MEANYVDAFWNVVAHLTTCDRRKRSLLQQLYFYHVTPSENIGTILTDGLDPNRCAQPDLHALYNAKYVCLTTETGIVKVIGQRDDGMGGLPDLALLRIPSQTVIDLEFDVDQTHAPIHAAVRGSRFASAGEIRDLLSRFHYLVVLDRISPRHIAEIPIASYLAEYHRTRA
jgi:hypothetical protein